MRIFQLLPQHVLLLLLLVTTHFHQFACCQCRIQEYFPPGTKSQVEGAKRPCVEANYTGYIFINDDFEV
ncbi:hypothetical protein HanIR_Chr11g0529751 [Helianthus annuus]|nr:hypothetical protein HanIR_Chr11g0529751 [Helianthus annuus]